jgi:hypothetical protein
MAIIFAENSEHGNAPALYGWGIITGAPAINSTDPMKGTYDIRVGRGGMNVDNMQLTSSGTLIPSLGTTTCIYTHFWYKLVTAPSVGNVEDVFRCWDNGEPAGVRVVTVDADAHLHGAGGYFQLVLGQKVEVELYVGLEVGVGLDFRLWVNGTLIGSSSAAGGSGATRILGVTFGNLSAAAGKFDFDAYYDDIVVDNASRIGTGITLETVIPNADDATEDEWRPSDEATGWGSDTWDHVNSGGYAASKTGADDATTQEELWAFPATAATGTVIGVDCLFRALRATGTGSVVTCWHRIKLGATGISTDISGFVSGSYRYFRFCRATDPDGNAWTKANADNLLAGGQRGADAAAYSMRINSMWKTVVYRDAPKDWAGII